MSKSFVKFSTARSLSIAGNTAGIFSFCSDISRLFSMIDHPVLSIGKTELVIQEIFALCMEKLLIFCGFGNK